MEESTFSPAWAGASTSGETRKRSHRAPEESRTKVHRPHKALENKHFRGVDCPGVTCPVGGMRLPYSVGGFHP